MQVYLHFQYPLNLIMLKIIIYFIIIKKVNYFTSLGKLKGIFNIFVKSYLLIYSHESCIPKTLIL